MDDHPFFSVSVRHPPTICSSAVVLRRTGFPRQMLIDSASESGVAFHFPPHSKVQNTPPGPSAWVVAR
jgi:hypothetical protein